MRAPAWVRTPWQHRGNTRSPRCVRCVRGSSQLGRSGRSCKHLARLYEVEGLVGCMARGGSSPLERIGFGWESVVSRQREAAREFQQADRCTGVATTCSEGAWESFACA